MLFLWSAVTPQNIARISRGQEQYVGFIVSWWCLAAVIRPVSEAAAPAPVPGAVVAEGAAVGAVAVAVGVAAAVVTHPCSLLGSDYLKYQFCSITLKYLGK